MRAEGPKRNIDRLIYVVLFIVWSISAFVAGVIVGGS